MRPILALNCLLQIEQERSEEESFVGDALALAFRCARFCSASLILFPSYSPAPLLMRPRHFVRSCVIYPHDSLGMLKSLREACIASSDHHGSVFQLVVLHRDFSLANVHQAFRLHDLSILTVPVSEEYVHSASLPFSGLLCLESCLATFFFRSFLRQLVWKWFSLGMRLVNCPSFACVYSVGSTTDLYTFSFVSSLIPLRPQILPRSRTNAALALAVLALTSSSMCTTLDNMLPR